MLVAKFFWIYFCLRNSFFLQKFYYENSNKISTGNRIYTSNSSKIRMFYGISRKRISINFTATIQRKTFSVIYSEIPLKFSLRSFRKLLTRGHTAKYFKTSGRTLLESDYKPVKQCFNMFHINFDQDVLPIVRRRSPRNF